MTRRYVLLWASVVLYVALLVTPTQADLVEWVLLGGVLVLVIAFFSAVRDIIANPRLELEGKVLWVVPVLLAYPLAVPAYLLRHGMPWRRAVGG